MKLEIARVQSVCQQANRNKFRIRRGRREHSGRSGTCESGAIGAGMDQDPLSSRLARRWLSPVEAGPEPVDRARPRRPGRPRHPPRRPGPERVGAILRTDPRRAGRAHASGERVTSFRRTGSIVLIGMHGCQKGNERVGCDDHHAESVIGVLTRWLQCASFAVNGASEGPAWGQCNHDDSVKWIFEP